MFQHSPVCKIRIREDNAFIDEAWLDLGTLSLNNNCQSTDEIEAAVRFGGFAWKTPSLDETDASLRSALVVQETPPQLDKLRRLLDLIAATACRLGMQNPTLDADTFEELADGGPMSIVMDTSAVIQGALHFIAKHAFNSGKSDLRS